MNSNLLFDFSVQKENHTITVKRVFAAGLELVWAAWTTPEILDRWWAPKPYINQTKSMEFRVGGRWLYSMVSPEGARHWCRADYKAIVPLKTFSGLDSFCDEYGNTTEPFPNSLWANTFIENGDTTTVDILITYKDLADLEKIIQMGFREGFTMAMGNLDEFLEAQAKTGK